MDGTRVNGGPVTQLATPGVGAVAIIAYLLTAQMAVKIAALGFVPKDMLIDLCAADGQMPFLCQPQTDLLSYQSSRSRRSINRQKCIAGKGDIDGRSSVFSGS
jgi:hypothetical protein